MKRTQSGFTLVELMIGLAIGLISTLVVMNVFQSFEGRKRTTTSGSDAQTNAALALHTLQREVKMAGYGITNTGVGTLGCEIRASSDDGATTITFAMVPLIITNGANGAPDALQIMASDKTEWSLPINIVVDHSPTAANFFVDSDVGVNAGDLFIAVPAHPDADNWCTVFQSTQSGGGGGGQGGGQGQNQIHHSPGLSIWNPPGGHNIFPDSGYKAGDYLVNMGNMVLRTYSISNALALQVREQQLVGNTDTTSSLYPEVVQFQAQYGKDTNADNTVDTYDNTTPTTDAGWRQVIAVRLALLVRSGQWEKDEITASAPEWDGGSFSMTGVSDWKHYRYRVLETIAPIRNMIWRE
ncbi:PilW family protein [Chitinibacteraceae bacterium HSL-7]